MRKFAGIAKISTKLTGGYFLMFTLYIVNIYKEAERA